MVFGKNDYNKFYHARLKRISRALNKYIIKQEGVSDASLEVYEDIEEPEIDVLD